MVTHPMKPLCFLLGIILISSCDKKLTVTLNQQMGKVVDQGLTIIVYKPESSFSSTTVHKTEGKRTLVEHTLGKVKVGIEEKGKDQRLVIINNTHTIAVNKGDVIEISEDRKVTVNGEVVLSLDKESASES